MKNTTFVVPAPQTRVLAEDGTPLPRLVRNPDMVGAPLPAEGLEVPLSTFWRRRIARGEVLERDPLPAPTAARAKARKEG